MAISNASLPSTWNSPDVPKAEGDAQVSHTAITLLSLVALLLMPQVYLSALLQWRSEGFSRVEGEMTKCELDDFGTDGESQLVVAYRYQVDGREYLGNTLCFAVRLFGTSDELHERRAKFWGVGRFVDVYYDPEHPQVSLLEPNLLTRDLLFLGVAVILHIVSAGYLLLRFLKYFGLFARQFPSRDDQDMLPVNDQAGEFELEDQRLIPTSV